MTAATAQPTPRSYSSSTLNRQLRGFMAKSSISLFGLLLLSVFLMPLGYMVATAFKDDAELSAQNAPLWPASAKTYTYQGQEYPLYLVPTEQGVKELPHDFLRAARELCTKTGTLLVHDEVQAGCGRTGTFLSADAAGVKPDVATLAKPIAAGLPMGCTVVSKEFADVFEPGDHGSTFAGGPFVCRGALVFLELMEHGGLQEAVRARGAELRAGLADLQGEFPVITELRGRGLMQGVRLARGAEEAQKKLYAKGLITNRTAGDVLRILPPYVVTSEQIARGISILREALAEL